MPEIKFLLEKLQKSWLKQSLLVGMTVIFISFIFISSHFVVDLL